MIPNELILTRDQEIVVEKINKFLKSDQRIFRVKGRAGSGKTTGIFYALRQLIELDKQGSPTPNVAGVALAHKAKNVLAAAGLETVRTFASAYGFKEKIHPDGTRTFEPLSFYEEPPIGHYPIPVFVHDEVSQYSNKMLKIIMDKTSVFSKIIFMGDAAQLPPIDKDMPRDADSPIFSIELPDWCQHDIKERVRQKKGNPILDLSDIIIEEIEGRHNLNRVIEEILRPKLYDQVGYLCVSENHFVETYVATGNFVNNKVIAFRNDRVNYLNNLLRKSVLPDASSALVATDLIFMTNNFKSRTPPFTLNNSEEFIIDEVTRGLFQAPHADQDIDCYFGKIKHDRYQNAFVVCPTEFGVEIYDRNINDLSLQAKHNGSRWKSFWEFKDSFSEFTMGYAINAYRSQGSTYDNVFIDLLDILTTGPLTPKRKLQTIYTAMTRARHRVYFIKP